MPCDAQSVETLTVLTDGYYKLSERQWLECLANLFCEIAQPNLALPIEQSAVALAYSLGYPKLSDVQLEQALLAVFTATSYDAQSIVNEIASKGYDQLSHADLRRSIVAAICAGVGGTAQTVETLAINTDQLNRLSEYDSDLAILTTLCAANSSQCRAASVLHWRGKWTQLSDRGLREVIAATAQYSITPPTPTGFTAVQQGNGDILVSWDVPPASVANTKVWKSLDGVTYALQATVAAPGVTNTITNPAAALYVKIQWCNGAGTCSGFTTPVLIPIFCPVPTLAAVMQSDLTVVVSWNVPPAGIDYTEIWASTDNASFVLAWVVAAPGITVTLPAHGLTQYFQARFCSGAMPSLLGLTWAKQVVTNGGYYPSSATTTAVDTFLQGLVTDGLDTLIVSANVFAPDSLIAALTPPVHNSGPALWINHNFVSMDLGVNGLAGDGSTKYLDTGVLPVTAGLATTEGALIIYDYDKNTTASGIEMGYGTGAADWILISNFITAGIGSFADCYNNTSGRVGLVASPGNGFYAQSRTGAGANALYFANSGTAFAAISSNAGAGTGITDTAVYVFATHGPSQYVNARISFAAVSHGLTSGQMQNLFNRVQTLRTSFGGGFR